VLAEPARLAQGDALIEAVLFDFNGVLVDDEAQHCETLQQVLSDEGIMLSRDDYYADYLGLDDRTSFVEAFRRANRTLTTEHLTRLVAAKTEHYQRLIARSVRMVSGAAEFVRAAAERFRLAIVSGALRREIEDVLARIGFAGRFEIIVSADENSSSKPDPAGYLAAHAALDRRRPIALEACVAIEDSLPGLAAARAAGISCVMLATSHSTDTLRGHGAAVVWESFAGHAASELATL
jgi:HAD superfamily hydrolase (TIGR01509 family)